MNRLTTANTFAERLILLRKQKGITQKVASDDIGIHVNTLRNYETGKRFPNATELKRIKNYYNVSYEYLFAESNIPTIDLHSQAIHKKTGLSENAIWTLNLLNKNDPNYFGYSYLKVINLLIENMTTRHSKNISTSLLDLITRYFKFSTEKVKTMTMTDDGSIIPYDPSFYQIGSPLTTEDRINVDGNTLETMFIVEIEKALVELKRVVNIKD